MDTNNLQKLNINDTLIVLADLQPEIIAAANKTMPEEDLRRALSILIEGANILEVPIFISVVEIQHGVNPTVIDKLNEYPNVVRSTPGVFDDESSLQLIKSHNRPTIVLGGVATELAVLQAALGALRLGYKVYLLTDLCGGLSDRTEHATFRELEAEGAILSSVASFLGSLMPPHDDPRAKLVFGALIRFMDVP